MADGEPRHLASIAEDLTRCEVRPTVLLPLWHVARYALGAATALLGREGAMVCTEPVEEVIDGHYARQERALGKPEPELREKIRAFRTDELGAPGHRARRGRGVRSRVSGARTLGQGVNSASDLAVGTGLNNGEDPGSACR